MGFFHNILNKVFSLPKLILSNALPSDKKILTEEELNEAIRLSKISLTDDFILNRPKLLASTHYALAVNYYRKANFYSNFSNEDIRQSIFHAHRAETFFTREEYLFHWQQLQQIQGLMYWVRGDGVRAEHFEAAIVYLEKWLDSVDDLQQQAQAYLALMTAFVFRIDGIKEDNLQRSEEYYKKALECYPADSGWRSYVNQQKALLNLMSDRAVFDIPTDKSFAHLSRFISLINEDDSWKNSGRFEPNHLFTAFDKFNKIAEKAREAIAENAGSQIKSQQDLSDEMDFFQSFQQIYANAPEQADLILAEMDKLIQENVRLVENLGEATDKNEKAEGEVFISMLYLMKAFICPEEKEAESELCYERAEFYFEKAWDYKTAFQKRPFLLFWQGKFYGTFLYFIHEKWNKAERLYKEALEALEVNYKSSMGNPGKDVILSQLSSHNLPLSLNYAFVLAKLEKLPEAVVALEKWRGRELNELLNRNNYMLGKVDEPDLIAYRNLWNEIDDIETKMEDKNNDEKYLGSAIKLRGKHNELDNIVYRIREYLPDFLLDPDFSMIQNSAKEGKPLAYLLTTLQGSLVLIVTSEGVVISLIFEGFTTGDANVLFEELRQALGEIKSGRRAALKEFARVLEKLGENFTQTLVDELKLLGADSVCLIPCGVLSQFPWHAAPTSEGRILLDFFDVSYAPTAKFLFDAQRKLKIEAAKSNIKPEKFVGIADSSGNLQNTVSEIQNIAGLWKNTRADIVTLFNEKATKEAIRKSLPSYVVHFACHGTFNASSPLDSTLILGGNEKLPLREILEQDNFHHLAESRLVVLSACQTALVDINEKPEENIGLPLGFLSRGIPGIIGTLWSVNDKSSALLMTKFYETWLKTEDFDTCSPLTALRKAQNWLRTASKEDIDRFSEECSIREWDFANREAIVKTEDKTDISKLFKNPYFWAGFVFIGV